MSRAVRAVQDPSPEDTGPLSPELFQKIKAIQIRTQRVVNDVFAGEYESAFKGRGMEFEEVREYQPGDDIRHIDWNVTARMSAPYVKVHREERELTVMLLVDVSSSGAFGSGAKLKNEVAAEVAALLAYTAIRSNDRVGLIIFSDHIEHFIPPKKGRAHVWRVIRDILTHRSSHRRTDLEGALEYMSKVVRRRAVADPGNPRHFAQRNRSCAVLGDQRFRRPQQRAAKVAVVIAAFRLGQDFVIGGHRDPA